MAEQRQTAVTAYLKSKQLLLFAVDLQHSTPGVVFLLCSSKDFKACVHMYTSLCTGVCVHD